MACGDSAACSTLYLINMVCRDRGIHRVVSKWCEAPFFTRTMSAIDGPSGAKHSPLTKFLGQLKAASEEGGGGGRQTGILHIQCRF